MSDVRLRELERRWRATGSLVDEVAWLRERRRLTAGKPLAPVIGINVGMGTARFKVAYVSPTDAPRCPATHALLLLRRSLQPCSPGELTVIATEGDRTLFFEVGLPRFDMGAVKARVSVYCMAGAVWDRAARRRVIQGAAGVVFVPSLVEQYSEATYQSAEDLQEDLLAEGIDPHTIPLVLQCLPGDPRPEVPAETLQAGLDLPALAAFTTDRRTGSGIEEALFEVLSRARAALLEVNGCP